MSGRDEVWRRDVGPHAVSLHSIRDNQIPFQQLPIRIPAPESGSQSEISRLDTYHDNPIRVLFLSLNRFMCPWEWQRIFHLKKSAFFSARFF